MTLSLTQQHIAGNLRALHLRLACMTSLTADAIAAIESGNQNLAVGTILDCEQSLPEALALFQVIMLAHRNRPLQDD